MRTLAWAVGGAAALLLCAGPWAGQTQGARADRLGGLPKARQAKGDRTTAGGSAAARRPLPTNIPTVQIALDDWPEAMARELKATEEQQGLLREKIAAVKEALAAYDSENGPKLKEAEEAAEKARAGGTAADQDRAAQQVKDLKAAREKFEFDKQSEALSVLTPDERIRWEGYRLYLGLLAAMIDAGLTADQEEQVRTMANVSAADIVKLDSDDARAAIRKQLLERVIYGVLTDRQRRQLTGELPASSDRTGKPDKLTRPGKPRDARSPDKLDGGRKQKDPGSTGRKKRSGK